MWGGVWDRAWGSNMENFTFNSAVRGYHVYKVVWKPTIGEKLQADQELGNEADKFALKVVKNSEIVGHLPREYSRTLWCFIARACGALLNVHFQIKNFFLFLINKFSDFKKAVVDVRNLFLNEEFSKRQVSQCKILNLRKAVFLK